MPTPSELISVSILDRDYQFTCPEDEREALKAAALFLDEKLRETKASGNLMALERIAVMTALNLSDELLKSRLHDQRRHEQVDQKIRMLVSQVYKRSKIQVIRVWVRRHCEIFARPEMNPPAQVLRLCRCRWETPTRVFLR